MDKPIQVGDLVQVVLPRLCGCNGKIGEIFFVIRFDTDERSGRCYDCGKRTFSAWTPTVPLGDASIEVRRLKRIPPLDELQTFRQTDETTV